MAANFIIHRQSVSTIKSQAYNANVNMLNKTSQNVDLVFKNIEQLLYILAGDANIVNLAVNPSVNYFNRNNIILNDLKNTVYSNEYMFTVYAYSKFGDTVLVSNGKSYKGKGFYDWSLLDEYFQSDEKMNQFKLRKYTDEWGNEQRCITIASNIPSGSDSKLGGVFININENKLYNMINDNMVNELENERKGQIFVVNEYGQIVVHQDKNMIDKNILLEEYGKYIYKNSNGFFDHALNGKKMHFTYVTSGYNGWKYIYAAPVNNLEETADVTSKVIIIISLLYILFGIIFSLRISRGIYKPIQKLVNLVSSNTKYVLNSNGNSIEDEYEFLGNAYSNVLDENRNMETVLNSVKPIIKEKLFINLLLGKNSNIQEISEKISLLGIGMEMENYLVILMKINDYAKFSSNFDEAERNLYKISFINSVEKAINIRHKGVCIEVESDKIAAILNFRPEITSIETQEKSAALVTAFEKEISGKFPFTVSSGIGGMYKDILNIKLSYEEALKALRYKLYQHENEILNAGSIMTQTEELYFYDSEKTKRLISSLKKAQKKDVERAVNGIFQEIMDNKSISFSQVIETFSRITSNIAELLINMGMTVEEVFGPGISLYEELSSKRSADEIKTWLLKKCNILINHIEESNIKKANKNVGKIIDYINNNLDREITLNEVADWVGLSPAYVSTIFKENIGVNFVDYLNRHRIEKSKQLLKDTKLSVQEVGFKVGFNNIRSFMRTFKKYEDTSPGAYRRSL